MGREFKVLKELATISATATEFAAVNRILCNELGSPDFRQEYDSLISDIKSTYRVVIDILQPLVDTLDRDVFDKKFTHTYDWYKGHYQAALSEPRVYAEFTFEKNLQFRKRKEVKTSYPLLKATFARLHDLIDKWIDNDIWLAMSIDIVLKQLNLCLDDIAETYKADFEEAYGVYVSCVGGFPPYLAIISAALSELPESDHLASSDHSSTDKTQSPPLSI